jgi:hypothetical protein
MNAFNRMKWKGARKERPAQDGGEGVAIHAEETQRIWKVTTLMKYGSR